MIRQNDHRTKNKLLSQMTMCFIIAITIIVMLPQSSYAACVGRCCNCNSVRNAIIDEVKKHQDWLVNDFWGKDKKPEDKPITTVKPAIEQAVKDIESFIRGNAALDGNVIEGQSNIDAIRNFQEQAADSLVGASASDALCRFGSLSKSLAASDVKVQEKVLNLSQASLDRELLRRGQKSAEGTTQDLVSRYNNFKSKFCDIKSYGATFSFCTKADDYLTNLDIDYTRLVDTQTTISDAEDAGVIPLMNNLFSPETFQPIDPNSLKPDSASANARDLYMDQRALIAKRSVAQNTFQNIVARRSQGTGGSMESMKALLKNMGIAEDSEVVRYLTDKPSYHSQMDILTKRIYQDADFFKNLMDNPTNLARQYAAMQSFGLMQQRDIYDSAQRAEILLSLIVELELEDYQTKVFRK
jgi:hypothetical protein